MELDSILHELVLIIAGAAVFATAFLYLKQPIILAYIALGVAIGPWGLGLINEPHYIEELSHIGIILLLFLIGLNFQPARMVGLLGKVSLVTLATCFAFMLLLMCAAMILGFGFVDSMIIGAALMFSSTIVSLKLIPTTELHHKHAGELIISVLLMQDIIAIILILLVSGGTGDEVAMTAAVLLLKLAVFTAGCFLVVRFVITRLFMQFDVIKEHTFLLSLGWGLMCAGIAETLGLSFEMGAFIAGVSLATVPIALVIAEEMKPLRDFFLILFFFSIGAQFNLDVSTDLVIAGAVITLLVMILKPAIFRWSFLTTGESKRLSLEMGSRLGQASEFSLLVAYTALASGVITEDASFVIQMVVISTFVLSTYWVVSRYPTPISHKQSRRRD